MRVNFCAEAMSALNNSSAVGNPAEADRRRREEKEAEAGEGKVQIWCIEIHDNFPQNMDATALIKSSTSLISKIEIAFSVLEKRYTRWKLCAQL